MKSCTFIQIALSFMVLRYSLAFSPSIIARVATRQTSNASLTRLRPPRRQPFSLQQYEWVLYSNEDDERDLKEEDDRQPVIVRGFEQDEISDQAWENIETGEPPKLLVMKELLGINIFTYLLAGLILIFLTANFILGPGWLGQAIGMKGTGTFTDISPSLPDTVDLNDPNFLL